MPGRPRQNHKLKNRKSPVCRVATIAAPLVTLAAVAVGVSTRDLTQVPPTAAATRQSATASASDSGTPPAASQRAQSISRSSDRLATVAHAGKDARMKETRYATTPLAVRSAATKNARVVDEVASGNKLSATGLRRGGFAEIRYGGDFRWVTAQYLSPDKPVTPPKPATAERAATPSTMGLSDAACPDSGVEQGLTAGAVRVHRAVCHSFPQITTYGGYAARGEHASGKAIDIMTSDVALGTQIADFLRAHAVELGLYDVIWRQQIWTPERSAEGWRSMPDRGSTTANHYDHVHVSVN
ncbi:MAG: SH3 domain-containing protein [Marmoricola sp.]